MLHPVLVVAVLGLSLASVHSLSPGFRARITQSGLDYANRQAMIILARRITGLALPDQTGSAGIVDYGVKNIRVTSFNPPSSKISLVAGTGAEWTISNADISMAADWQYSMRQRFLRLADRGSLSADVKGVLFSVAFNIAKDSSGRLSISTSSCSGSISSVRVNFQGGRAFIYNFFRRILERIVRDALKDQLCTAITKAVNEDAKEYLASLPMTVVLAEKFLLDYRLVSPPIFTTQYLETNHKGGIYWKEDMQEAPFSPAALAGSGETKQMLQLWLSDYMANSLSFAAFGNDYLHYNITSDMLPSSLSNLLNTRCTLICVGKLIPEIGTRFPDAQVKLVLGASSPPSLKMTPGRIRLVAQGDLGMVAVQAGGQENSVLSLNASLDMEVSASVRDAVVTGKVENAKMKIALIKSDVGNIQIGLLQTLLDTALKAVVIPKINEIGAEGLVLPVTKNIRFVNPKLVIQENTLTVSTDVNYERGD